MKTPNHPAKNKRTMPATDFCATVEANVDNGGLSDAKFREFIRTNLPIVMYRGPNEIRHARDGLLS